MRVLSRGTLLEFWRKHADAEGSLKAWFAEVSTAKWKTMVDIKKQYATASVVDRERVVFNIGGNKYRLVVNLWFPGQVIWIKFIGTHRNYDQIDVKKL
jgi:mRNA interferase HigB